jgi:hypothetical protein
MFAMLMAIGVVKAARNAKERGNGLARDPPQLSYVCVAISVGAK